MMSAIMDNKDERKAIDLSHHLSKLALARDVSPLKGLARYLSKPNLIMLAGGFPAPEYFPFHELSAEVLTPQSYPLDAAKPDAPPSWFWRLLGAGSGGATEREVKTKHIAIPKFPADRTTVNLATALQYSTANGMLPLQVFTKEFVAKTYKPAYDDWTVLSNTGNTDGWSRVALTLMNPGDGFLTEEWSYPSALSLAKPYNINPVSVAMDGDGMRPDILRKTLSEWDESARGGMKRPRVIYTVPVGQNPSGANMSAARKKLVYDICVEYDIIICEDDPYYFQQEGEYVTKDKRRAMYTTAKDPAHYIDSLVPSYLRFDYQGRVIRLDTFSKTMAPGSRLGWFTCSPAFAERLERQGETSTQAPCGFSQTLITQLLLSWKYDGYVRWLQGLSEQYKSRRDYFIDCLAEEFDLQVSPRHAVGFWEGCNVHVASEKVLDDAPGMMSEKRVFGRKQFFSFVPPAAGMFVWLKLHFDKHPDFIAGKETEESLEMKLFVAIAEEGVLFAPGWFFAADQEHDDTDARGEGHFRISFSSAQHEEMQTAVRTFRRVLERFFA